MGKPMPNDFEQTIDEFSRYRVGVTKLEFTPSNRQFKHMLYLVAYDVCDPKRLRQVAKICEDYGVRVEYSVFECDLKEVVFRDFWRQLLLAIDTEEDVLLAYRICGACVSKIESAGMAVRPGKILLYMI